MTDLATALSSGTARVHADVPDNRAARFRQTVGDAEKGAVNHPGGKAETHVFADI